MSIKRAIKNHDDRRVRRTKRALHEAILALVADRSYSDISIQEIVDAADLNRGTFYLHYGSKDELLFSALQVQFDVLVERMQTEWDHYDFMSDPAPIELIFDYVGVQHKLFKALLSERGVGSVMHRIIAYIAEVDRRQLEDSMMLPGALPVEIIAHYTAGSLFALLTWWIENGMPYTSAEMARMYLQLHVPSMALMIGEKAPKRLE